MINTLNIVLIIVAIIPTICLIIILANQKKQMKRIRNAVNVMTEALSEMNTKSEALIKANYTPVRESSVVNKQFNKPPVVDDCPVMELPPKNAKVGKAVTPRKKKV